MIKSNPSRLSTIPSTPPARALFFEIFGGGHRRLAPGRGHGRGHEIEDGFADGIAGMHDVVRDGAVRAVGDLAEGHALVARALEHGDEVFVFLRARGHVVISGEDEHRRSVLATMENRRGFVGDDCILPDVALLAHGGVGHRLAAQRDVARERIRGEPVRLQPAGVHREHECEPSARGVAADENLLRIAATLGDVRPHPGDGGGGILEVCRIGRLRAESVIYRRHSDSVAGESARDLRSFAAILRSGFQRATVKPDEGGEIFSSAREVEIELAALLLVFVELVAGLVGEVCDGPNERGSLVGARRGGRREEEKEAEQRGESGGEEFAFASGAPGTVRTGISVGECGGFGGGGRIQGEFHAGLGRKFPGALRSPCSGCAHRIIGEHGPSLP